MTADTLRSRCVARILKRAGVMTVGTRCVATRSDAGAVIRVSDPESKAVGNPTCPTGGTITVERRGNHANVVCSCGWRSPPAFTKRMVEADREYHVKGGRA